MRVCPTPNTRFQMSMTSPHQEQLWGFKCFFPETKLRLYKRVWMCVSFGFVTPAHVSVFDCDDALRSHWGWRSRFRPSRNWRLCVSGHWTREFQSRSTFEAGENRRKWRWCKWIADFKAQELFICLPFLQDLLTTYCREVAGFAVCLSVACVCVCAHLCVCT